MGEKKIVGGQPLGIERLQRRSETPKDEDVELYHREKHHGSGR